MTLRVLAVLIFCLGLFCLSQQPRAYWQSRDSNYNSIASSAVNNTSLDGTPQNNSGSGATIVLPAIVTTGAGGVYAFVLYNGSSGSVSVSGSTLGAFTQRSVSPSGNRVMLWFVPSSGALAGEVITATTATGFCEVSGFAVKNVKTGTNNGFDTNGVFPLQSSTSPISIITSNANDFIIIGSRNAGDTGAPTNGFTRIVAGSFLFSAWLKVTATQPGLSGVDPAGSSNGMLGDALVSN